MDEDGKNEDKGNDHDGKNEDNENNSDPPDNHSRIRKILNNIVDCNICTNSLPSTSRQVTTTQRQTHQPLLEFLQENERTANQIAITSEPELSRNPMDLQVYRSMGPLSRSANVLPYPTAPKSLTKTPPTYSTVIRLGPACPSCPTGVDVHPSIPFIARQPPPSYSEVAGLWAETPSTISSESAIFGPEPVYLVCPDCSTIIITELHYERSNYTHLTALVLCLCGCWPCCLLPYCINSCSTIHHVCPVCQHYFGMYRPW